MDNNSDLVVANQAQNVLPKIELFWDGTAGVQIKFDDKQFKTWNLIIAVLGMAKEQAETMQKIVQSQAMQQQMIEQAQAQEMSRRLRR